MEQLDKIFKKLSHEKMDASGKVWENIYANQQRKRNKMLWWLTIPVVVLAIGVGLLFSNKNDTLPAQRELYTQQAKPSQKLVHSTETLLIANGSAEQSPPMVQAVTRVAPPAIPPAYIKISDIKSKSNPVVKNAIVSNPNAPVKNFSNETITGEANTKNIEPVVPNESVVKSDEPSVNEEIKPEIKKDEIKIDEAKPIPVIRKKQDKTARPKYIRSSLIVARNYRKLVTTNDSFAVYKNLRNAGEISTGQAGVSITMGVELNKHTSIETGLMYLPQKISSSYTWQQIKNVLVIDSVVGVDTFSHTEKRQVPVQSNGDIKFNYLKLPLIINYEFSRGKMIYYVGGGASVNILLSSAGSIRNFETAGNSYPIPVSSLPKNALGVDLLGRAGTRFAIRNNTDFTVGISGGYNVIDAFGKKYPLIQHNFWYGLEMGLRWSLK